MQKTTTPVREIILSQPATVSMAGAQQNDMLRALSRKDLEHVFADLELVHLPAGKVLHDCGSKYEFAYFPTNAIVSLLYVMEDGATTEIGVVGREGVVGMAMYESERATCSAVVQTSGYGYRLRSSVLRSLFAEGGAFAQIMMTYTFAMFGQMAQNVVGGRHCNIEQKLARWLLDRLDRSLGNELKVTQETIATMLGVRRESVTMTAGKLQEEGLIQYRRGTITVLDRAGLERAAGSCYKAARVGFDHLQAMARAA